MQWCCRVMAYWIYASLKSKSNLLRAQLQQLLYCAWIARPDDSKKELTLNSSSGAWTFGREIEAIFVQENHSWCGNWYQILGDWIPCFELWGAFGECGIVKCFRVSEVPDIRTKFEASRFPAAAKETLELRVVQVGMFWTVNCEWSAFEECKGAIWSILRVQRRLLKCCRVGELQLSGGRGPMTQRGVQVLLLLLDSIRWQI